MTGKQRVGVAVSAVLSMAVVITGLFFIIRYKQPNTSITLTGVVLEHDKDPQKQAPVAFANLTATTPVQTVRAKTDASGLFRITIAGEDQKPTVIGLKVEGTGYLSQDLTIANPGNLQVLYLDPATRTAAAAPGKPPATISNVRVRYSEKATSLSNIGSVAKTFQVVNKGDVPCNAGQVCSPDGKWKAAIGSVTLASEGNEFRNPRLSCIAGPCPFTRVESELPSDSARNLTVSVRNWSSTTTFLLEAEVSRLRTIDAVRESYPAIFGRDMTFTLPATAEGLSIEAEIDGGGTIIFPLGPNMLLSWAVCTVEVDPKGTRLFRCSLKPGYEFK